MKAKIELQNLPMLLERYYSGAMEWPVWVERKHNGVRCVIVVPPSGLDNGGARAYSREGRVLEAGIEAARDMDRYCGPGVYDGELCGPSFRETLSQVKRKDPAYLRYKVWDRLSFNEWLSGRSFQSIPQRRMGLVGLMVPPWHDAMRRCVDLVPGGYVHTEAELQAAFDLAIRRGWEGLVVKDPRSGYHCNERRRDWMKMKPAGVE